MAQQMLHLIPNSWKILFVSESQGICGQERENMNERRAVNHLHKLYFQDEIAVGHSCSTLLLNK